MLSVFSGVQLLTFFTLSSILFFCLIYLKQNFKDWAMSLSSGKNHTQLGAIHRASPFLRTPEPKQGRIYKPDTT
jgi:hypothetical protein